MKHGRGLQDRTGGGVETVLATILLAPLHGLQFVGEQRLAGCNKTFVRRATVEGEPGCIFFICSSEGVVADEINGAIGPIRQSLPHHPPDPLIPHGIRGMSVVPQHEQSSVGGDVETHALMHHRHARFVAGDGARLQIVDRENRLGLIPVAPVAGGDDQRLAWGVVLTKWVTEILQKEPAIPIGERRRMAIGPTQTVGQIRVRAIGPHDLNVLHPNRRAQASIVNLQINSGVHQAHRLARATRLRGLHGEQRGQQGGEKEWPH